MKGLAMQKKVPHMVGIQRHKVGAGMVRITSCMNQGPNSSIDFLSRHSKKN